MTTTERELPTTDPPTVHPDADRRGDVDHGPGTDAERVADLEAELARVKADRTAEEERLARRDGWRRFFSAALAIVAAVSIVVSVTGIWLRVTVLDSDRFAAAAAPLVKNDDVARAISEYAAAEIVAHTGAQREIAEVLPADAQVLAGPIASALQDGLATGVDDVIQTDEFESVFETAVRVTHEEALLVLEGDGDVVESRNGLVTLNLLAVINDVMKAASDDLSALFGTTITLPEINPDDIPADQIAELESALGVQLPADFGQVTLFESDQLADAQRWGDRFDALLEVVIVVAIASTIGAFALAFDRRRTVITMGIAIPVVAIVTWLLVDANENSYVNHVDDPMGRAAARAAADTMFAGLDRLALWTIGLSVVAVIAAVVTRNVSMDDMTAMATPSSDDETGESTEAVERRDEGDDPKEADHE